MRRPRAKVRRTLVIGLFACAATLAGAPAAEARGHWAPRIGFAGRGPHRGGWHGMKRGYAGAQHGPFTFDPRPAGGTGADARNPDPGVRSATSSGSVTLPNGHSASDTTTVTNAGGGVYDYSASATAFNGANGSVSGIFSK